MGSATVMRSELKRAIDELPQLETSFFTPYTQTAFDDAVRDYCQNRIEQQQLAASSEPVKGRKLLVQRRKSTQIYDHIYGSNNRALKSCKVILSGDVAVGKTSLMNRFGHGVFSRAHQSTIGIDFDIQRFQIMKQNYMLQIWDTAGLERYKCINSAYYRASQVVLLVFDVSNMGSLASVLKWRDEVFASAHHQVNGDAGPLLFLVGTKYDLPLDQERKSFIEQQANKIAQMLAAELWFVSSLSGHNVGALFNRIAALAFNRCILAEIQPKGSRQSRAQAETAPNSTGAYRSNPGVIRRAIRQTYAIPGKVIQISQRKEAGTRTRCCINSGLAALSSKKTLS